MPRPDWEPIKVGEFWERQGHQYNGSAHYRVSFVLPKELEGQEVWLIFGAIADYCLIVINDHDDERFSHLYWRPNDAPLPLEKQAGPRMNISKSIEFGKESHLVVFVNNIRRPGGIWKPVKLAVKGRTAQWANGRE